MTINTGGGGINIPIRIGMSPAQAQQAANATGRAYGQAFQRGFATAMTSGGNPLSRLWGAMTGGISAAGYGNYTGPRTPGTMAATYLWRGMFGRGTVSGMAGRLGATALGFGALGTLPQAIGEHIQTSRVQEQMLSDLNRRTGESFKQFSQFRDLVLETGKDLGYTRDQIIQMTNAYVSGVGRMDQKRLSANLGSFMQLGKAYGIDPQAVVGLQTQMFRAGGGLGTMGTNAALAASIEFGGMRGRENEVINSIEDLTTMLERRLPTVTGGDMASMLGLMTQMNATGNQGLAGQRGVGLIGSVNQFMTGEAGGPRQNLMYQMIQSSRMASGQGPLDYASLIRQSSRGLGSMQNRQALAYGINKFLPQGPYQGIWLSQMLGISPQQADDLMPVLQNPQALASLGDLGNVNALSLPFIARASAAGGVGGARDVAREFAGTMDQRTAGEFMGKVNAAGTPDDVARLIAKYGDQTNQLLSSADQTTKAFTDFENSLTDLGGQMNKVLKDSLAAWTNIFNLLGGGAGAILDMTGASKAAALAIYAMSAVATAQAVVGGARAAGNAIFGLSPNNVASVSAAGAAVSTAQRLGPLALGGLAARRLAPVAAILGAAETATDIMGGADPTQSVLHHLLTTGGTIGGGLLGGLVGGIVGGGVGAVPGSIVGGIGGNAASEWLWQNVVGPQMSPTGRGATGRGQSPFNYPISGDAFGVYSSYQKGPHTGVDFGMKQGTPVGALGSGTIQYEGQDPTGMGGNWLMVDYGNGLKVRYAHMSNNSVLPVGSRVNAGDLVGYSGGAVGAPGSGTATTGPHLLMEAWQNGKLIDPMTLNRPDMHTEAPMSAGLSSALQSMFGNLRLQGTLSLTVAGAANGQYNVPVTMGGGTMAGILNGAYGGS